MRITAITVNAAGMAAEMGTQGIKSTGTNQVQTETGFGAECKVTISQEGKKLSSLQQQAAQTDKSAQNIAERMLRRSQEEAERDNGTRDEYRDKLDEIDEKLNALNSSYNKKKDRDETIGKQQEVLRAMRNLKEFQEEQSQRLAKEAQQAARQSAGYQNEIDKNNRELLTLLKTMEEAEDAEEERENGGAAESSNGGNAASGTTNSTSDVIKNSAAHYVMSSAEREWGVQEAIVGLGDEGRQRLKLADTITQNILNTTKGIRTAMDDELYTDEQIGEMVTFLEDGTLKPGFAEEYRKRGWKIGMQLNYDDVEHARSWGLQNLQDAQEAKIQHFGDHSAENAQETKKGMMLFAVDAALGEARQGSLDKASRELEEEVKKLVDERSDVDRIRQDREQDEEDQEKKTEKKEEQTEMQAKLSQAEVQG